MRRAFCIAAVSVLSVLSVTTCGDEDSGSTNESVSTDSSNGSISPDDYLNPFEAYLVDLEANGYEDYFVSDDDVRLYLRNFCDRYAELGDAAVEDDIDRLTTPHCGGYGPAPSSDSGGPSQPPQATR